MGRGGATRGQGRVWSIQNAELWGASEEAMAFVSGNVGEVQLERVEERRRKMHPELGEADRKKLEEAGKAESIGEAVDKIKGVIEGAYVAIGEAVGALREETIEWRKDMSAHMAATDRQNRKRHLEFSSPALRISEGAVVTEEECLQHLSSLTEEKYGIRLTWADVSACHPLGGKTGGRAIALFKNTNQGSPFARLLQPGTREGGARGLSSRIYLKVEMSSSSYDATIKDMIHWYKEHVAYMRREARGKGWKEEEAVPAEVYVMRYSHERLTGKLSVTVPGHRNVTVTSARELIQLIGQRCLDAYIMKVPATTWIRPRGRDELPTPSYRGTGGNREPVRKSKGQVGGQQQPGSGRKSEEKKKGEEKASEEMEVARDDGDRESLAPSEVSIWDLVRSPRIEDRFGLEDGTSEEGGGSGTRGSGDGRSEALAEKEEETSFVGRVKGPFKRSFL